MKVRAAVLREAGLPPPYAESGPLEVMELDLDPPGPGELLVRVRAAGLCHSDLSVIDGSRPRPVPMVLGHEAAGEVVEVGPEVERVRAGDHVVLTFVPACGRLRRRAVRAGRRCASRVQLQTRRGACYGRAALVPRRREDASPPGRIRLRRAHRGRRGLGRAGRS